MPATPSQHSPLTDPQSDSNVLERDGAFILVTDLDTAAFLYLKGLALSRAIQYGRPRPGRPPKFKICFYDPHRTGHDLAMRFVNGEEVSAVAYANSMKRLKQALEKVEDHGG